MISGLQSLKYQQKKANRSSVNRSFSKTFSCLDLIWFRFNYFYLRWKRFGRELTNLFFNGLFGVVRACNGSSFWRAKFSFGIIGIINSPLYWKLFRFYFNFDSTSRLYFVFSFLSSPFLNTMSFERWCGRKKTKDLP